MMTLKDAKHGRIPSSQVAYWVAAVFTVILTPTLQASPVQIEQWGVFETTLQGPADGNPFVDVELKAIFTQGNQKVSVAGFYDGEGLYRIRFSPSIQGEWTYLTTSNRPALSGKTGSFTAIPPSKGNHGPVRVADTYHFAYADGTRYIPFGTTCYAWIHQEETLQEQTLKTLSESSFNKIRMCVFPKHYDFNTNEPLLHPFVKEASGKMDFARFNPAFFQHLEQRISQLSDLGIEADIILFHPYDRWGYAKMDTASDERYIHYIIARLAAYRNVWWSLANEYDLMLRDKPMEQWDRFFQIIQENDPSQHLRSIHNCTRFYDHTKPWVTHASIQATDLKEVKIWRERYHKPIIDDELEYEGNIKWPWGSISAEEIVFRFWMCYVAGGYAGHGETYMDDKDVLWWSKGGVLKGQSPKRLAFLRRIIEETPREGMEPMTGHWVWDRGKLVGGKSGQFRLVYFGQYQPSSWNVGVPDKSRFKAEIIDTWNMTITPLDHIFEPRAAVPLPGKPNLALRLTPVP